MIYSKDDTPAVALLTEFIADFGTAAFEWEAEECRLEIKEKHNVEISDIVQDKLQAAINVFTRKNYDEDILSFENINRALLGIPDILEHLNPLSAEELIGGYAHALIIREGQQEDGEELFQFHPTVRAYAGWVFYEYGMSEAPDIFPEAIMPDTKVETNKEIEKEKNEALDELFSDQLALAVDSLPQE